MDVEALYPSVDIVVMVEKVCILHDSKVNIEDVYYKELGLYFSLVKTDEKLQTLGIHNVYPKRRLRRGSRPNVTGWGTNKDKDKQYRP